MSWVVIVIGGLITGVIAKALLREKQYGIVLTTCVGLIGSIIGSLIARGLGYGEGNNFQQFAISVIGAVIFLGGLKLLRN